MKPIPGYEVYLADEYGNIFREGKKLTPVFKKHVGYLEVRLSINGYVKSLRVHRLVATTFLGIIPEGYHVNHKNGIKTDNSLLNLEIVTPQENYRHSAQFLIPKGEKVNTSKVTADQVREIRIKRKSGIGTKQLCEEYSLGKSSVKRICNRTNWKHID